jgi:hypothetical protein
LTGEFAVRIENRITELLGVEYPILQAPMGWIARSRLASAAPPMPTSRLNSSSAAQA